jgi:hypothetical protein
LSGQSFENPLKILARQATGAVGMKNDLCHNVDE